LAYITGGNATAALNPASYQTAGAALFRNIAFANNLSTNAASVLTFGANLEGSAARRTNALNAGLPANFFFVNPATPSGSYIVDNSAESWYDSGVIEVRRRLSNGIRLQANYVFAKALSNARQSNDDVFSNFTHREGGLELARNVAQFDIRHAFKMDATIDLPFGKGRQFFSNANWFTNALIGGFSLNPVIRWQSGSPFIVGNVQLVGMTVKELQREVKVRKGPNVVTFLPDDIILNTQRAFNIDPTTTTGYGTTFEAPGSGADPKVGVPPTGRFIAPAGYGNCQQRYVGECGFNNLILYGPSFFKFDLSASKRFIIDEKRNIELRATFLDVLNKPAFRVGGFNADIVTIGLGGTTFGQLGSGSAYQDVSTTNDPGGRIVDLMLRINF
jgi:hypothetical protein